MILGQAIMQGAVFLVGGWKAVLACLVATLFGLVAWPVLVRIAPETEPVTHVDDTGSPVRIPTWAWALGLMAVAFGLGEGTAMGWSGILVTDVARVPAVQGSMAVTVVAAFMVIIRLLGDRLVARFGRRTIVRVGGVCASAGYFVAAFATPLPVLLEGSGEGVATSVSHRSSSSAECASTSAVIPSSVMRAYSSASSG